MECGMNYDCLNSSIFGGLCWHWDTQNLFSYNYMNATDVSSLT